MLITPLGGASRVEYRSMQLARKAWAISIPFRLPKSPWSTYRSTDASSIWLDPKAVVVWGHRAAVEWVLVMESRWRLLEGRGVLRSCLRSWQRLFFWENVRSEEHISTPVTR